MLSGFKSLPLLCVAIIFAVCVHANADAKSKKSSAGGYSPKYSALVIDAKTGVVLHQKNAGEIRYPASLVKMMTLYMTFQALERGQLSMDQKLKVSAHAAGQPASKLYLKAGSTIPVREAILALSVKSANDVAVVLAEAIGGTESQFAAKMTKMAKRLGMTKTNFVNASGLHHKNQTTAAYDMAKLAIALRRDYPRYYPMFDKSQFSFNGQTYRTHNRVAANYPGADGLKTGFVNASGFNLVTSARRGSSSIVGVVLGGPSTKIRDRQMVQLLDKAFYTMERGGVKKQASYQKPLSESQKPSNDNAEIETVVSKKEKYNAPKVLARNSKLPFPNLKPGRTVQSAANQPKPKPSLKPAV